MTFHFGCISKRPNILVDMGWHFISDSVYMIFYLPKMKFDICQNDRNEITPAMSFERTCALDAISNESALIHFALVKFCSHKNLMSV